MRADAADNAEDVRGGVPGSRHDRFGRHIHLEHLDPEGVSAGGASLRVKITEDHLNGAEIAHGGVLFAALDEAVAIVANRSRPGSVLTTGTLHCLRPAFLGDVLEASVEVVRAGRVMTVYNARLVRDDQLIA